MRFVILLGSLALVLAGCVTTSNEVPRERIADIRVGEISVSLADGAQVPADLRDVAASKVKAAMEQALPPKLKGPTPVRFDVKVRSITIASELETVIVGSVHTITADVACIDLRTKAVLFTHDSFKAQVGSGGGAVGLVLDRVVLSPPIDRVASGFAFRYSEFLWPEPRS